MLNGKLESGQLVRDLDTKEIYIVVTMARAKVVDITWLPAVIYRRGFEYFVRDETLFREYFERVVT